MIFEKYFGKEVENIFLSLMRSATELMGYSKFL